MVINLHQTNNPGKTKKNALSGQKWLDVFSFVFIWRIRTKVAFLPTCLGMCEVVTVVTSIMMRSIWAAQKGSPNSAVLYHSCWYLCHFLKQLKLLTEKCIPIVMYILCKYLGYYKLFKKDNTESFKTCSDSTNSVVFAISCKPFLTSWRGEVEELPKYSMLIMRILPCGNHYNCNSQ